MSIKQTKIRFVRQMTETVMAYLTTKNSFYTTVITIIAVVAPFSHLLAKPGQAGFFGFQWMSSFLFALGWPISTICVGLLLHMASEHIVGELRKGFALISTIIIGLGIYYLAYTLIPMDVVGAKDFSPVVYYLFLFICTLGAGIALRLITSGVMFAERKLRHNVQRLVAFIINSDRYIESDEKRKQHFRDYMGEFDEITK